MSSVTMDSLIKGGAWLVWTGLSDAGTKVTHYALKQFSLVWLLMSCPHQTCEAVCYELSAACKCH